MIPISVLRKAQGLAIFSVARLGFLMSARAGSGVVLARMSDDSWSAPSAIGLGGLGAGFNAGLDVTDFVIVLNSRQAVRSFMATGSLQLGGNLSVAVGPLGRAAEASGAVNSSGNLAAMFSYSKSKGLYGGVSVEGTVLIDRGDANSKAYQRNVTAKQILSGSMEVPDFASSLISLIEKFTLTGEVRAGMDGRSARARGYGNYDRDDDDGDIDSLDRELRAARVSSLSPPPASSSQYATWDNEHGDHGGRRTGQYAFGSESRGSMTNSPTRTRKSFLGGTSPSVRGTDYGVDETDPVFDSNHRAAYGGGRKRSTSGALYGDEDQGSFARSGVQPRRNAPPPPTQFEFDNSRARSQRAVASFPTKFNDLDADEEYGMNRNGGFGSESDTRDPFSIADNDPYDYPSAEPRRRTAPISSRRDKHDDLDLELDREARQRQHEQADLIDLGGTSPSYTRPTGTTSYRRKPAGMDSLDEELQQRRDSVSTNESRDRYSYERTRNTTATTGWRSDFGLPDDNYAAPPPPMKRPPMHQRTSSAQKLWNRVRGNSQSSRNAFADPWEARRATSSSPRAEFRSTPPISSSSTPRPGSRNAYQQHRSRPSGTLRTPSPNLMGSSTPPPAAVVAAAIGRTGSATPTGLSNGLSASRQGTPLTVELQVVALFDFEGQEQNDLSFKRGDVIDILRRTESREDWWLGLTGGRVGK